MYLRTENGSEHGFCSHVPVAQFSNFRLLILSLTILEAAAARHQQPHLRGLWMIPASVDTTGSDRPVLLLVLLYVYTDVTLCMHVVRNCSTDVTFMHV